jgi:hypothetical protein
MSGVVESDEQRRQCLERVLALNPDNQIALRGMTTLQQKHTVQPPQVTPSPIEASVNSAEASPLPKLKAISLAKEQTKKDKAKTVAGLPAPVKLSKPIRILVGLATAWLPLYLLLFLAVWFSMFTGFFFLGDAAPGPSFMMSLFPAIFPLHCLTLVIQLALMAFYLFHVIKNTAASDLLRVILGVGIFFMPLLAMPVYFCLYIWTEQPPEWARAKEIQQTPGAAFESSKKGLSKRSVAIIGGVIGVVILVVLVPILLLSVFLCGYGPKFIREEYDLARKTGEIYIDSPCPFRRRVNLTKDIEASASIDAWSAYEAWSPDRKRVLFVVSDWETQVAEIFVVTANGRQPKQLTQNQGRNLAPDWSPGGTRVAFQSNRDGNEEIYLMNADGSNQINLTSNSADDKGPSWAPPGIQAVFRQNPTDDYIAFTTYRDGNAEVYIMNVADHSIYNLSNNPERDDRLVTWFEDGSIYYSSSPLPDQPGETAEMIANVDGSQEELTGRLRDPQLTHPFWWLSGR